MLGRGCFAGALVLSLLAGEASAQPPPPAPPPATAPATIPSLPFVSPDLCLAAFHSGIPSLAAFGVVCYPIAIAMQSIFAGAPPRSTYVPGGPNRVVRPCEWWLTATSPAPMDHWGGSATFMNTPAGPGTMIMLLPGRQNPNPQVGSGTITVSGLTHSGSYTVGTAAGFPPSGVVYSAEDGAGRMVGISAGDGAPRRAGDGTTYTIPTSTLDVGWMSATEIKGRLNGTFWIMDGTDPPNLTQVKIDFWARDSCP